MSRSSVPQITDPFLRVAIDARLLTEQAAGEVAAKAQESELPTSVAALRGGFCTQVELDIVETLLNPLATYPGYEVQALRGRGGMGVVYRAVQQSFGRIVAIKSVLLGANASPASWHRFEQEARILGRLKHANIVVAYDFGRVGQRMYLVLEYVEGEDAESYVAQHGPFDEANAWLLIGQAAAGLAYALDQGIVHRDVKPANMLLVGPSRTMEGVLPGLSLKLTDFGLALLTSSDTADMTRLTQEHQTIGSPHYMAPEQFSKDGTLDHRADIYSLGCTAYLLLTGQTPFSELSLAQLIAAKLQGEYTPLRWLRPDLSSATCRLVERMMSVDRTRRPSSYHELIEQLDDLAHPAGWGSGLWRPPKRPLSSVDMPTHDVSAPQAETRAVPVRTKSTSRISLNLPQETGTVSLAAATTSELKIPLPQRWWERRTALAVLLVMLTGAGLYAGWWLAGGERVRVVAARPDLRPLGTGTPLFDGQTLQGWRIESGVWQADRDEDGAAILSGESGAIVRPLDVTVPPNSVPTYRVIGTALASHGGAATLAFGSHPPTSSSDPGGWSLAFVGNVAEVWSGDRPVGSATAEASSHAAKPLQQRSLPETSTGFHEFRLERHTAGWFVFVDGDLLGLPLPGAADELPQIRLIAGRQAAGASPAASGETMPRIWFSDLTLELLGRAEVAADNAAR